MVQAVGFFVSQLVSHCFYGLSLFLWRGAIDQSMVVYKTVDARSPWELW